MIAGPLEGSSMCHWLQEYDWVTGSYPLSSKQLTNKAFNKDGRLLFLSFRFPTYHSYLNGRVVYDAALALGSCLIVRAEVRNDIVAGPILRL